jgi:hypothetical protein
VTAPQVLQALIDKVDTLELVRDQIAAILLAESANQQALARAAGKDPQDWALRLFVERNGNCWHQFTSTNEGDDDASTIDPTPIVNVWVDHTEYDKARSDPSGRQQANAVYHLDIYGYGVATATAQGHDPGEMLAAFAVQRAYRLIRNTLISPINENLQMIGVVGDRWINSFKAGGQVSASEHDKHPVENVSLGRVELEVSFLEYAPEYQGVTIEAITGTVKRAETGEIYFTATPPLGV